MKTFHFQAKALGPVLLSTPGTLTRNWGKLLEEEPPTTPWFQAVNWTSSGIIYLTEWDGSFYRPGKTLARLCRALWEYEQAGGFLNGQWYSLPSVLLLGSQHTVVVVSVNALEEFWRVEGEPSEVLSDKLTLWFNRQPVAQRAILKVQEDVLPVELWIYQAINNPSEATPLTVRNIETVFHGWRGNRNLTKEEVVEFRRLLTYEPWNDFLKRYRLPDLDGRMLLSDTISLWYERRNPAGNRLQALLQLHPPTLPGLWLTDEQNLRAEAPVKASAPEAVAYVRFTKKRPELYSCGCGSKMEFQGFVQAQHFEQTLAVLGIHWLALNSSPLQQSLPLMSPNLLQPEWTEFSRNALVYALFARGNLCHGFRQGVVTVGNPCFFLTDGQMAALHPRLKADTEDRPPERSVIPPWLAENWSSLWPESKALLWAATLWMSDSIPWRESAWDTQCPVQLERWDAGWWACFNVLQHGLGKVWKPLVPLDTALQQKADYFIEMQKRLEQALQKQLVPLGIWPQ